MHRFPFVTVLSLVACAPSPPSADDSDPAGSAPRDTDLPEGTWNPRLPPSDTLAAPRGRRWLRTVVHLHSPYSHDACDGQGWSPDGLDTACEQDLYDALCAARIDLALLTDHPDYGDRVVPHDRFPDHVEDVELNGTWWGGKAACGDDPQQVLLQSGYEDELMPVGLRTAVSADPETRHDLLNRTDDEAIAAMQAAGGRVFLAHTEGRRREDLLHWQDQGLHGIEAFNIHAAFAPDIRERDLGLSATGWAADIGPFVTGGDDLEPDLLFLPIVQPQTPSLAHWDALLARGPMMATLGSDAHQNVLPTLLTDGERVDSYRRILRVGTTWLLADDATPVAIEDALSARRAHVVFELLGTPDGLDVHLRTDTGDVVEVGGEGPGGTLVVGCPTLAPGSPRGSEDPVLRVSVLKDGAPWAEGCGEHTAGPGVYRVEIHQTPEHLRPFLGAQADRLVRETPWVYTGAIRVVGDGED